jgi:hypothetical protein
VFPLPEFNSRSKVVVPEQFSYDRYWYFIIYLSKKTKRDRRGVAGEVRVKVTQSNKSLQLRNYISIYI